eukprot:1120044-Pelagomonas_calceolata.AAC.1
MGEQRRQQQQVAWKLRLPPTVPTSCARLTCLPYSRDTALSGLQRYACALAAQQCVLPVGARAGMPALVKPTTQADAKVSISLFMLLCDQDDAEDTLAARLAQKYYSRLFKEYCIADLSRYRESKLGLRWRSQKEVVAGKGHFSCGAKGCDAKDGLVSYEVNFAYQEAGREKQLVKHSKNPALAPLKLHQHLSTFSQPNQTVFGFTTWQALVKLRVCPECAFKLNYRKEKQFRKAQAKALPSKKEAKRGRAADGDGAPSSKAARYTDAASEQGEDKEYVVPPPCRSGHYEEQVQQQQQQQQQWQQQPNLPADNSVWENKAPVEEVVNLDEELDTYFDGAFLLQLSCPCRQGYIAVPAYEGSLAGANRGMGKGIRLFRYSFGCCTFSANENTSQPGGLNARPAGSASHTKNVHDLKEK